MTTLKRKRGDPAPFSGTGGTVTNYTLNGTNFTAHLFKTVGTTSITFTAAGTVQVLVVGAAAAAVRLTMDQVAGGGGGGAGGLIFTNFTVLSGSNYAITVGDGGPTNTAANGGNSLFGSLTALGGGYGGRMGILSLSATNGGCGGGGFGRGTLPTNSAGTATQPGSSSGGYGNNGGLGEPGRLPTGWRRRWRWRGFCRCPRKCHYDGRQWRVWIHEQHQRD